MYHRQGKVYKSAEEYTAMVIKLARIGRFFSGRTNILQILIPTK